MNKTITLDGVEYNLVPVLPEQEATKETKYRKNGALVYAPEFGNKCYSIDLDFEVYEETFLSKEDFNLKFPVTLLEQGLVFDNKEACQIWADKRKVAYELKQRIVESESKDEVLNCCSVFWNFEAKIKDYNYGHISNAELQNKYRLTVSTNAKDILMSDDVSDEDFKSFIEVFSL